MIKTGSKYLRLGAYVLLLAIFIFTIGIARDCERINFQPKEGFSGGDTLDIALIYGPGSYYFYGDTISGINRDIALQFEKDTQTPVKLWPVANPSDALAKLQSGAFNILASLPLDNYIKKKYPVSESIFLDRLVLIQLVDSINGTSPINSSLDLNGKKIYVVEGSTAVQRLKNLSDEIGGKIEIKELEEISDELLCLKVASGDLPLAVVNERIAKELALQYPNLKYDTTVSFTQFQVWVFNPADTVATANFNIWFENFKNGDTYRSIIDKY